MKKLFSFYFLICLLLTTTSVLAQESSNQVETETTIESSSEVAMYVNASKLNVRQAPSTSGKVLLALKAPSKVVLLSEDGEWSQVSVEGITGYVASEYLVASLEEVTVEGVDFDYAYQNPDQVYRVAVAAHAASTKAKAKSTTKASGPSVYFCNSGNVVKYHSNQYCRGLNRCSSSVDPIPLRQAQSSMDPCKICY